MHSALSLTDQPLVVVHCLDTISLISSFTIDSLRFEKGLAGLNPGCYGAKSHRQVFI